MIINHSDRQQAFLGSTTPFISFQRAWRHLMSALDGRDDCYLICSDICISNLRGSYTTFSPMKVFPVPGGP